MWQVELEQEDIEELIMSQIDDAGVAAINKLQAYAIISGDLKFSFGPLRERQNDDQKLQELDLEVLRGLNEPIARGNINRLNDNNLISLDLERASMSHLLVEEGQDTTRLANFMELKKAIAATLTEALKPVKTFEGLRNRTLELNTDDTKEDL